jgi:tripartite-type tricarboxylate transporter receptor subunit TctC
MRRILLTLATLVLLVTRTVAFADTYPSKPVQLIVPFPAGGGSDVLMRAFGEASRRYFPETVVVMNKPGAIGTIGFDEGARARPDGYTVTMLAAEVLIAPYVKMGRSTYQDFELIGRLNVDPGVVVVKADAPWKSAAELAAEARKHPGDISVATGGYVFRVAMAGFEDKFGLRFNHVPYQGEGPAALALLGGQVSVIAVSPSAVAEFVRAGKLRIIGAMSETRLRSFPNAPTFKEQGFDYSAATWRGLGVPKGTPADVQEKLKQLTRRVTEDAAFRKVAEQQEIGIAYQDAVVFRKFLETQDAELRKSVPKANLGN